MTAMDRAALLFGDLERTPEVLRVISARRPWRRDLAGMRKVVLTGLGSSRFAALVVEPVLREAGLTVVVEHASASRPAFVAEGSLFVAVSSSGSTPETVAAIERAREAGALTLAITNNPDSPLALAADEVLALDAGVEDSGVASVSYCATVAVLAQLAAALGAGDPARSLLTAADGIDSLLGSRGDWLPAATDCLDGAAAVHVLADASALGTAEQAALLLRECPRLEADATDAGDWLHVGLYTALPGYRAMLLAGTRYDAFVADTIHGRSGRVLAIGPAVAFPADSTVNLPASVDGDHVARVLVESAVTTAIAAELWRRTVGSH